MGIKRLIGGLSSRLFKLSFDRQWRIQEVPQWGSGPQKLKLFLQINAYNFDVREKKNG